MKRQINRVVHTARQAAKAKSSEIRKFGSAVHERIVDSSDQVISQVSRVKEALPNRNLKRVERIIRTTVVGNLNAAIPCMLKDLPTVAKSLANRAGSIASDKLFNRIPAGVKLSEESIVEFLRIHDVSHRISIKNAPAKAGDINNVIFEIASRNRARGSKNMSWREFQRARFDNTVASIKCGFKTAAGSAAKGALFGALLEVPVTVTENTFHVKNNRKSFGEASKDAAKDIGISAGLAGATAAGFTGLSLLGVTLGPVVIPLTVVGGAVYTWSATDRIWKALGDTTKKKLMNSNSVLFLTSVAHQLQITSLHRDLDKIRSEQSEAVADLITAREQEEIADMLSGISMDGTSAELARMREIREKAKARSTVAQELAGTDSKSEVEEFLAAARSSATSDEFDTLIFRSTAD